MAACRARSYPPPERIVHAVCPRLPWPGARPAAPATTSMAAELFLVGSKRLFKAPASHGSTPYGATNHDTPSSSLGSMDIRHDHTGHSRKGPAADHTQPVRLECPPFTRLTLHSSSLTDTQMAQKRSL